MGRYGINCLDVGIQNEAARLSAALLCKSEEFHICSDSKSSFDILHGICVIYAIN